MRMGAGGRGEGDRAVWAVSGYAVKEQKNDTQDSQPL